MKYGHLASFCVISLSMLLKKFERYNLGQLLLVFFLPFTQGYPITFGLYSFLFYQPEMREDLADPGVIPSRFTAMLYLEVTYFMMWLLAIIWALAFFYFSKFQSPYNPETTANATGYKINSQGQKEAYFWTHKNSDDFLKYIKREIFEIAYLSASAQMTIFVMIKGHDWTLSKKKLPSYQYWICVLLIIERFGTIISRLHYLVMYMKKTREERKWMNIYRNLLKIFINLTIVGLYFYDQAERNK